MLYVAVPLYPGTDRKDVIRVSRDLSQLDDSMRRMRDLLYWLASGTLLGALVFSYMMSRLLARPLHAFTRVVREVVRGQSQPEALSQTASTAQLLLLADAISTLIAELERVRKRVRRDSTQLAALLDAIDLPVIFVNPAGQIIRVNTAAHSQLDLPHTTTHLDDAGLSGLRSVIDAALSAEGPMSTHIVRTSEEPGVEPQRWLASVVPIAAHGSQQGVVLVLRRPADSHPAPLTRRSVAHMKAIPRPDPSRDPSPTGERWG
jgi:PAS domain-containing protein